MGPIFTLGFHYIKLLFKSKSFLLILFIVPMLISAFVTFGLQRAYVPTVVYLKKKNSELASIDFLSQKAKDAGQLFKDDSELYPMVKKELDFKANNDVPEVAENISRNFLGVLLPSYYPIVGNLIDHSMTNLNTILIILLSISWLPAIVGVFLMNLDKKNQTLIPMMAQGISSNQYVLSKVLAGIFISLFIIFASIIGYSVGAYLYHTSNPSSIDILISINAINYIFLIGIIGSICTMSLSFLLAQIIKENMAQIILCGMLVPLFIIFIFLFNIKDTLVESSLSDIKSQTTKIDTKRFELDKKITQMGERQIYISAQKFAVKLGSELIPKGLKLLPKSNQAEFSNSMIHPLNAFAFITLLSIILSMGLAFLRFRNQ